MFDESGSMKDDQRTIADKFDRVVGELKLRVPSERREAGDLEHAIVGFGQTIHFEDAKPRADLEQIRRAIDALPVDESGEEQTMEAVGDGRRPLQPGRRQGPQDPAGAGHRRVGRRRRPGRAGPAGAGQPRA